MNKSELWGIDLGGTKIEAVVMANPKESRPIIRKRIDTLAMDGYPSIVRRIKDLIDSMAAEMGYRPGRIGMGTPGVFDPVTHQMKNCNTACLNGQPLPIDIEKALGIPTFSANDANCFALAEALWGSGKGAHTVFGVILGTGVGGGIVLNGQVHAGAQGIAGEWGHNVLDPEGPQCYCRKKGCNETIISGPALEKFYEAQTGNWRKLSDIADQVDTDPAAAKTIDRLTAGFGRALSVVINILDPDVIVLGGGVSNLDALYTKGLEAVAFNVFNNRLETKIVKHSLGDSAGVFGAALLARIPDAPTP